MGKNRLNDVEANCPGVAQAIDFYRMRGAVNRLLLLKYDGIGTVNLNKNQRAMDRNTFIKIFYLITAGIAIPKLPASLFEAPGLNKSEFEQLFEKLDSGFLLKKYAGTLGREYLLTHSYILTTNILMTEFDSGKTPQTLSIQATLPGYDLIQSMIQSDFESDNTVRLQGWVLSETEAKLCSLYRMTT